MIGLRSAAEQGRQIIRPLLASRGLVALEDVQVLERDKLDNLLEQLSCASLEDLYASIGGGAVSLEDVMVQLDRNNISKEALGWITINIIGPRSTNRPGVLQHLAGLVSSEGGNIIRSVQDTMPDGSFALRLVITYAAIRDQEKLKDAFLTSGFEFKFFELV
jgi:guanosine-3',5'-bis(diphosphate) 3'-pyrophosphohydrolase